jgi:hypothetical protein
MVVGEDVLPGTILGVPRDGHVTMVTCEEVEGRRRMVVNMPSWKWDTTMVKPIH